MDNLTVQELWFEAGEVPKNVLGKLPKKYRDQYILDEKGTWLVKKRLGFLYTQFAWFFAFDDLEVDPSQFEQLDYYKKHISLAYGAAKYWCIKNQMSVFFNKEELERALRRSSYEKNEEIVQAEHSAVFDDWMQAFMDEDESPAKKK